jgi:hypothetical protein
MRTIRVSPRPQIVQQVTQLVRQPQRSIFSCLTPILAVAGFVISASTGANGQATAASGQYATGPLGPAKRGIEHVLYLSVKSDPASPLLTEANGKDVSAKVIVTMRISAHSQETSFFGLVPAYVSEFDLAKGSKDQIVWRDGKCHRERGIPKISVTKVEGQATSGQQKHAISARWRIIGMFLPRDEVTTSRRMGETSTDNIGSYFTMRTETKQSRLLVDLKLYTLHCDLTVATQRSPAAAVNR